MAAWSHRDTGIAVCRIVRSEKSASRAPGSLYRRTAEAKLVMLSCLVTVGAALGAVVVVNA